MELESFITPTDKELIAERFKVSVRYVEMILKGTRSDGGSLNANGKAEQILNSAWLLTLENTTHLETKRKILGLSISQTQTVAR